MATTGALRCRLPVEPQNGMPPAGKVKMPPSDGGEVVTAPGGCRHRARRDRPGRRRAAGVAGELCVVVKHRPCRSGDRGRAVRAADLIVVDLAHAVRRTRRRDVARQSDPDRPVRVVGHQRRVLQSEERRQHRDGLTGAPVEHHRTFGGGRDHVVVAGTEVGRHHRSDDAADVVRRPDDGACRRVEGEDRP